MSTCCCNEAEQYICVPCKWKRKQMNDKDKEEYEKWLEAQNWYYDSFNNEYYQNGLKISIYGETEEAWQAACDYKQREIEELNKMNMFQESHRRIMGEKLEKLQDENAKLRECVEFYADYKNDNPDHDWNNDLARQVLKELDER